MNEGQPGVLYTENGFPAAASSANTAVEGIQVNPFEANGKIYSADMYFPEAITGDDTNSQNYRVYLADGTTEIARLLLPTGVSAVKGIRKAMTIVGTATQCVLAAGAAVLVVREEVGTAPVRIAGAKCRIGWRSVGG